MTLREFEWSIMRLESSEALNNDEPLCLTKEVAFYPTDNEKPAFLSRRVALD